MEFYADSRHKFREIGNSVPYFAVRIEEYLIIEGLSILFFRRFHIPTVSKKRRKT